MIELLDSNVFGESSGGGDGKKYNITVSAFLGDVDSNGVLQLPTAQEDLVLTGVKEIPAACLSNKFKDTRIKSLLAPDLETLSNDISLYYAFYRSDKTAYSMESASFPKLETISGIQAMASCFQKTGLKEVSFPKLKTISGTYSLMSCFESCDLKSVSFPELTTISGSSALSNCFAKCTELTDIFFPKLETISSSDAFSYLLPSAKEGVALHFKSGMETTVQGLSGYPDFGGTSTVILYDL